MNRNKNALAPLHGARAVTGNLMYDELVKRLRTFPDYNDGCTKCPHEHDLGCRSTTMREAADAIEELSCEAEEYKAAYRKEHNKRIAENRYLYDELTKVVKEKLLMTPMRIEVSEPQTAEDGWHEKA